MRLSQQEKARRQARSMPLLDFYEEHYRPARHPGDPNSRTCSDCRSVIRTLSKPAHFAAWKQAKHPRTRIPNAELYKEFSAWFHDNEYRELMPRVADLCDLLVVNTMSFLVEMGCSRATANKVRVTTNALWRYAARFGLVEKLPNNDKYKENLAEPLALLPDQLEQIFAAAGRVPGRVGNVPAGEWWPAALLFIYSLGIRISAAMQVPTANLDFTRGEVLIPAAIQKQRRDQWLDLFPSAVERLKNLRLVERGVPTVLGDWPFRASTLRKHYRRILVDAGLYPSVEAVPHTALFHCLRKTLASQLFEVAGIHVACSRLGHSTIGVTQRYIDPRYRAQPMVRDLLSHPRIAPSVRRRPPAPDSVERLKNGQVIERNATNGQFVKPKKAAG